VADLGETRHPLALADRWHPLASTFRLQLTFPLIGSNRRARFDGLLQFRLPYLQGPASPVRHLRRPAPFKQHRLGVTILRSTRSVYGCEPTPARERGLPLLARVGTAALASPGTTSVSFVARRVLRLGLGAAADF